MKKPLILFTLTASIAFCCLAQNNDKVPLGDPKEEKVPLQEPKLDNFQKELGSLPDGVLKVKTNPDGTFKSLIVKATVEIDEALGAQKGKRAARKDAEIQCKRSLSQWLKEYCVFAEAQGKVTTIITKGESAKDAAGNKVTIRNQEAKEVKTTTEGYASVSSAVLKGLIILHSEVTNDKSPEYALVLGLSQQSIAQAGLAGDALSGNSGGVANPVSGNKNASDGDLPAPENKTNPEAKDFL